MSERGASCGGAGDLSRRDALKVGTLGVTAALLGGCDPAGGGTAGDSGTRGGPSTAVAGPADLGVVPELGPAPALPLATDPIDVVRVGFVGVGLQGGSHVRNFLRIEGVEIVAICDVDAARAEEVASWVVADGRPAPRLYTDGERDFVRLCETEELDLVFNSTPWRWHVPVCVAAMENGKHAATEVPAAYTVEGCWQLVETAEATGRHCVMMENCNYDRPELMVLQMAQAGVLGEILHAECGYLHDLRAIKFADENEGLWRRAHSRERNGNLYPTHGLGPVANVMDINRGDQFDYLVSMSSPSRGLQDYAQQHYPEGHPKRAETFVLGDVNTALIRTARGRTIYLSHDTNLPRPYSRIHMVRGTKGLFQGYPNRVHVEGRSESHRWDDWTQWLAEFDHPLWRELEERAQGAGHGGMDYIEDARLVECLRAGQPTDMNVYDAAALSVIGPLTEWSVANGSQPVKIPDFTRGRWQEWPRWTVDRA